MNQYTLWHYAVRVTKPPTTRNTGNIRLKPQETPFIASIADKFRSVAATSPL